MLIFPAIDIRDGNCVRLFQGKFSRETVYGSDPGEMAQKWRDEGAGRLHVVDLDGARLGEPVNLGAVEKICAVGGLRVQLGGGIRDMESLERVFEAGVHSAIIGTGAVTNADFVAAAARKYPNRIIAGIDAKDGFAATNAWEKISGEKAVRLAGKLEKMGVSAIIYTDISTDGTMKGPNIGAMKEMKAAVGIPVIASGGVGSLEDIKALGSAGIYGVIVGRALYTGDLDLGKAISEARR